MASEVPVDPATETVVVTHRPLWQRILKWIGIALAALAIGSSLTRPPVFGLLSQLTPADEQGATLGVAQSAGSLARIFGPLFAATLFDVKPAWPYLACAGVSLLAGLLAYVVLTGRAPALWPIVAGDLLFTGFLLFALWRLLGRR